MSITDDDVYYMQRRAAVQTQSKRRRGLFVSLRLEHPLSGYTEVIRFPRTKALVFGPLYLIYHGAWGTALLAGLLIVITFWTLILPIIVWLALALTARAELARYYARRGWRLVP